MPDFVPNPDQMEGLKFLLSRSFGALFWDAGTRKTSTILFAYKILRDLGMVKRMMVTSMINVTDDVWPEEIEKWDDLDVTYAMVRGGARRRMEAFDLDADIYLCNMENIEWLFNTYGRRLGIDMLYVDESSKFRNAKTDRFRALRKMLPHFKRRYIGTATPTPKGYMNLWSQMFIVDQGVCLGDTKTAYKNKYFLPAGFKGKQFVLRDGAEVEIQRAIRDRVHRVEKHLNVKVEFADRMVELPPAVRLAYRELEEEFITEWQSKTLLAVNAAVATAKLRQAANGAIYYESGPKKRQWVEMHRAKIEELKKIIKSLRGEPLLIAYEFEHDYQMMLKCGLKIPSYSKAKKGAERTKLKNDWNARKLPYLSGQINSISHGLNAQFGGHNVAYYGLTYDLEAYEQLYQRLWRDGQEHDVTAWRIAAVGTVDETMIDVLHVRDADQRTLLSALLRRFGL